TKHDVLDWEHSRSGTPTLFYSDLMGLKTLPAAELKGKSRTKQQGEYNLTTVRLENPTNHLAFFVHLRINKGSRGGEVLPIVWEDNYFSLMPGERKEATASYRRADLQGATPVVQVDGWNVPKAPL